ncbi:MAG: RloB family protein [Bacteroidales bacterium]|nr:RloB family protein [Bacteroidales bacterium]
MQTRQKVFVVGEGITEQYYFKHLSGIKGYCITVKPRLFTDSSIGKISQKTTELLQADVKVICVFDADVSQRNAKEKAELIKFKQKHKGHKNVIICDSLPAIEFWFLLHYHCTHKQFTSNKSLVNALKSHINSYCKKKHFLEKPNWVIKMSEKQDEAVKHAKAIEKKGGSYSNIFKAIEFLDQRKSQQK